MCYVSTCDNPWPHLHIMPIEEMLAIDTCEIPAEDWLNYYCCDECDSVNGGYLEFKRDDQYEDLVKSINEYGFQPGFAPEVLDGMVQEGHHRITAMYDISGHWCPWQDSCNRDQWSENWEHYVYSGAKSFAA